MGSWMVLRSGRREPWGMTCWAGRRLVRLSRIQGSCRRRLWHGLGTSLAVERSLHRLWATLFGLLLLACRHLGEDVRKFIRWVLKGLRRTRVEGNERIHEVKNMYGKLVASPARRAAHLPSFPFPRVPLP